MHHSRRDWLRRSGLSLSAWGALGASSAPWFRAVASEAARSDKDRKPRSCILLWMSGGPSQFETLDPKPGAKTGGPTKAIPTATPGVHISENLPKVAEVSEHLALIRSMSTKEGDHQRASFVAHTGRAPQGPIAYPTMGSFISKELGGPDDLPLFVSINSQPFFGNMQSSGFLGPEFAPVSVGGGGVYSAPGQSAGGSFTMANLKSPTGDDSFEKRWKLLQSQQRSFAEDHPDLSVRSHQTAVRQAREMMRGRAQTVFDLKAESEATRTSYGATGFGRGCLLARRLVESGVPFVEVSLNGWDTHNDNFKQCKTLCEQLDQGWAALVKDLADRGLLDSTLVVWMGEFGRTPTINAGKGRDHYPRAWSAAMAGAGTPGGAVVGRTSDDGRTVEEQPATAAQWLATICSRLDLDITKQNMSNVGRPIRLLDPGVEPVKELL